MIRSAAAIRASLDEKKFDTGFQSRYGFAVFTRNLLLSYRREFDRTATARCRSVRQQQRWEARQTDGLPVWL